MLQQLLPDTLSGQAMLVLFFTGVILHMITTASYKKMRRAAENAGKTKKQWVQTLKKRFENYERFGRVRNVEAFVEHYFSRKGIFGIHLAFWDRSVLFLGFTILLAGIGSAYYSFQSGISGDAVWIPLFQGSILSIVLFAVHRLGNYEEQKAVIRAVLTDYLANGAAHRVREIKTVVPKEEIPSRNEVEAISEAAVTEEEKQVLMDVLEDYFW